MDKVAKINNIKKGGEKMKNNKGFSLIELVIVVTILAVIAVVGFQQVGTGAIAKSKASTDVSNAALLAKCIDSAIQEDRLVLGATNRNELLSDTSTVGAVLIGDNQESSDANIKAKVYTQKIPIPQRFKDGKFNVTIDAATGKIRVYAGSGAEGTVPGTGTQLFPRKDTYTGDALGYDVLDKAN